MFSALNNPITAYQNTGIETGVEFADSHQLILMLFEGARQVLAKARLHLQHNEIAAKGEMISKAIMIIDHGLKASLDISTENEIANNLFRLYEYMTYRLLVANAQNDPAIINEVNRLLYELYEAWETIGENKAKDLAMRAANE